MTYPDWVEKYREAGKEIKQIHGRFYLYERKTVWDKDKKQPKKISGAYLGRITEDGLLPPKKEMVNKGALSHIVDKQYGSTAFLEQIGEDIRENLEKHFPNHWRSIWVLALLRTVDPQPFKRAENAYEHSWLSEKYSGLNISKQYLSLFLRVLGDMRGHSIDFMKEYIKNAEHLLFDGTRITSFSEEMQLAQIGYNSAHSYDPQVNLVYAFSSGEKSFPVYFRPVAGSICDVTAFKNCCEELGSDKSVIIADKGFGSAKNFKFMEENGLKYIIPLRRNCKEFDTEAIRDGYANGFQDYFQFNGRPIWYFTRLSEDKSVQYITYIDDTLRAKEEADYIIRLEGDFDGYTRDGFMEKRLKFGSILLRTNTDKSPKDVYLTYKKRMQIEESFDMLKNLLQQDHSYMRSDVSFAGWAFINHISLMLCYRLYDALQEADVLKKYSLKDAIYYLNDIRVIKINGRWQFAETTKKARSLLKDLACDGLISEFPA